jgi:hypothetical protein
MKKIGDVVLKIFLLIASIGDVVMFLALVVAAFRLIFHV